MTTSEKYEPLRQVIRRKQALLRVKRGVAELMDALRRDDKLDMGELATCLALISDVLQKEDDQLNRTISIAEVWCKRDSESAPPTE